MGAKAWKYQNSYVRPMASWVKALKHNAAKDTGRERIPYLKQSVGVWIEVEEL